MADHTIEREIVIDAPPDVVWRTITEPDQIVRWFADRVKLDLRSDGAGALEFDDSATMKAMTAAIVVDAIEPPHRFAFRWSHPEGAVPVAGNSVLVEFTLTPERGERTRLRVVETGLDTIAWSDDDKDRYVTEHRDGWDFHLGRLERLFSEPTSNESPG